MNINLDEKKYIHICNQIEWENKIKNEIISKFNDISIIEIDCYNCKDKYGLMREVANKLKFPSYFSYNWDSFDECLNDLEWIEFSSLVILLKNAKYLLANEIENLVLFYDIISTSASEWNEGRDFGAYETEPKPFYIFYI